MRLEDLGDSACCLRQVQHLRAVALQQEVWHAAEAGLMYCLLLLVLHLQPMASDETGDALRTAKNAGQILGHMLSLDLHQEVGSEIEIEIGTEPEPSF